MPTRRELFINTGLVLGGAFLAPVLAGCASGSSPESRKVGNTSIREKWNDSLNWEDNLAMQGKFVEADMTEVGIKNNGWHELVSFERLTLADRENIGIKLPESGYFLFNRGEKGTNVTFLVALKQKDGTEKVINLTAPAMMVKASPEDDTVLQMQPAFDLAKFISYSSDRITRGDHVESGYFNIEKHNTPEEYFTKPKAITGILIKGSPEYLPQFPSVGSATLQ